MKDLEHTAQLIENFPSDIRAEVLMADLIQNGFLPTDFMVLCKSVFKRGYGRDILKAEKIAVNDMTDMLAIHLSRDGLYDLLPDNDSRSIISWHMPPPILVIVKKHKHKPF